MMGDLLSALPFSGILRGDEDEEGSTALMTVSPMDESKSTLLGDDSGGPISNVDQDVPATFVVSRSSSRMQSLVTSSGYSALSLSLSFQREVACGVVTKSLLLSLSFIKELS